MDKDYYLALAKVRLERAQELAAELLEKGSYKSANNLAFSAMEKAIKVLLATERQITINSRQVFLSIPFININDISFGPGRFSIFIHSARIFQSAPALANKAIFNSIGLPYSS